MDAEQILAFRLARSGLASREDAAPAQVAACPASDFSRDAAILALAARSERVTRAAYDDAVEKGRDLVLAHLIRGAIHAVDPAGFAALGRALVSRDDCELAAQLGGQVKNIASSQGIAPTDALEEVAEATRAALEGGRRLTKNELHDELRGRVRAELMPWCKGCGTHHVAPMLWRYGGVVAGVRLDAARRYVLGEPAPAPAAADAVSLFLRFYGPATPAEFADWAGVASPHARRLWKEREPDLVEVPIGRRKSWIAAADLGELESSPGASGVRLLPPGDPYLQKPNRTLLAPDEGLRKRMFRPVASPGVVLADGRVEGLWRVKMKGTRAELSVERIGKLRKGDLEAEAERVAALRGAAGVSLTVS